MQLNFNTLNFHVGITNVNCEYDFSTTMQVNMDTLMLYDWLGHALTRLLI